MRRSSCRSNHLWGSPLRGVRRMGCLRRGLQEHPVKTLCMSMYLNNRVQYIDLAMCEAVVHVSCSLHLLDLA